jgi:tetratricopeptide (TPR) repeat protein
MSAVERTALVLLRQALDRDPEVRAAFLAAEAAHDPTLRDRAFALLAQVEEGELAETTAPATANVRLGPWRLLEPIGRGGMGVVYLAERADGAFERRVAIKRVRAELAPFARRFRREQHILARLQHPHVAQLLDAGLDEEGHPWFALEYVQGETITRWCDGRRATIAQRVELVAKLCGAVQFAHGHLVVHGDIKPANVLVDADGEPKLLDFGIARLLDEGDAGHSQVLAMTPAYAAPEQRLGEPVTTATDVWALGLLLRELLAGDPAVGSPHRLAGGFAALLRDDPAAAQELAAARGSTPQLLRRELAGDLEAIVAVATAADPAARFTAPSALAEDLGRWSAGHAVRARGDDRGYRLRRFAARRWPAIATAAVALTAVTFHLVSVERQLERTRREREKSEAVARHFVAMFREATPGAARAGEVSARELLRRGVESLERSESGEHSPAALAALRRALGEVHAELGLHAESLELYQRSAATLRQQDDPEALAEALRGEAAAYYRLDRPDLFVARSEEALAVAEEGGLAGTALHARLLGNVGIGHFVLGDSDLAWQYYDRALQVAEAQGSAGYPDYLRTLYNAGGLAITAGDFERGRRWLEEAERLAPQLVPRKPDEELFIAQNLAKLALYSDRLDEARRRYDAVIEVSRQFHGEDHPQLGAALSGRGETALASGRPDEALPDLEAARRIFVGAFGEDHGQVLDVDGLRAFAMLRGGDAPAAAELLARNAVAREGEAVVVPQPLLEQVARERARCAGDDRAAAVRAAVEDLIRRPNVLPWQRRLAELWLRECG